MKSRIALFLAVLGLSFSSALLAEKTAGDVVDDTWLHTKVKAAMVGHGSSGVNVEVYHGVVQLAGFLTGEGNKKKLVESAQGVKGVKKVSDQLYLVEGDRSAGRVIDDDTLTGKVKAALIDDDMGSINVEVNRGNVLLSGFVDNEAVRTKAVDLIKQLKGVESVINGMDIKT